METVLLDLKLTGAAVTSGEVPALGTQSIRAPFSPSHPQENLFLACHQIAAAREAHPAILFHDQPLSYQGLMAAAIEVRDYLLSRPGFRSGTRVAVMLDNSPEYVAAFYGVLAADGVVVPLPARMERERWRRILQSCEPALVFSQPEMGIGELASGSRGEAISTLTLCGNEQALADVKGLQRGGRDLAMILFTSGSTGTPKGVMLSHRNLLCNAQSILGYLPIRSDDRALVVLPFCHAFGNSILQTHILAGATLVLDGSLAIPSTVLAALQIHRATSLSGVPEVYSLLLRFAAWEAERFPNLRYMSVAGGALRPELAEQVSGRISPAKFFVMYGQSEATARLAYLPPDELSERRGSIGKAIPGVALRIVTERRIPAQPDEPGMLQARGDNIMLGYWRDPTATEAVLEDGWLSTGDHATMDSEGYVYLHGRASELVKLQGNRVHPAEVEEVISRSLPGIQAAVLPYQSEDMTRLALFFASPAGVQWSEREVRQVCNRELPRYKIPTHIERLERLPLNHALKVDRPFLVRKLRASDEAFIGS